MLIPVACAKCGKPFQVPESGIGQMAACPWCKADVPALPVAEVTAAKTPQPLSLDDEPAPITSAPAATLLPPSPSLPRRSAAGWLVRVAIAGLVLLVVFGFSFAAARYGTGWVPEFGWVEFAAPDGSCRAEMPAAVSREDVYEPIPDFRMTRPGQRFTARGWYSKAATSVGWVEIERDGAKALPENLKVPSLEHLAGGEMSRRKKELNAASVDYATVKRGDREGIEARYQTPAGITVDRMILAADGPKPRLYVLSYSAPALPQDEAAMGRFFHSFKN